VRALRDFECPHCGALREVRAHPWEFVLCHGAMRPVITVRQSQCPTDRLWPLVHEHLGHEPVLVKSWQHYNQLLKERNFSAPLMD